VSSVKCQVSDAHGTICGSFGESRRGPSTAGDATSRPRSSCLSGNITTGPLCPYLTLPEWSTLPDCCGDRPLTPHQLRSTQMPERRGMWWNALSDIVTRSQTKTASPQDKSIHSARIAGQASCFVDRSPTRRGLPLTHPAESDTFLSDPLGPPIVSPPPTSSANTVSTFARLSVLETPPPLPPFTERSW